MAVLIPTVQTLLGESESFLAYETVFTAMSITNNFDQAKKLWSEVQKLNMLSTTFSVKLTKCRWNENNSAYVLGDDEPFRQK